MRLGRIKQLKELIILCILFQGVLVFGVENSPKLIAQKENSSSSYDLNYSYTMNTPELTFSRVAIISRDWDKLFLNLSVQTYGEPIDEVFISVKINIILTEQTFSSNEREGLKNCLVYQFNQPQFLIVPLNYSHQEILTISFSIHLDSLVSWREVEFEFTIFSAILHFFDCIQPLTYQPLMIVSNSFLFTLPSSQMSYFGKRLLLKGFIIVDIPDNMYLSSILEITILGGQFEYISLETGTNYNIDRNFAKINTTVTKDNLKDQTWAIKLCIIPFIDSQDEYSVVTITIEAKGVLKEKIPMKSDIDLIDHPIPGFIMTPFLICLFFGIPYYYVYQEELADKDDRIIDSKLGKV